MEDSKRGSSADGEEEMLEVDGCILRVSEQNALMSGVLIRSLTLSS